jgi:predicted transcriptional regulator of viral defense system
MRYLTISNVYFIHMVLTQRQIDKAVRAFRNQGGVLRTAEAMREGIQPRVLYAMRDERMLETLARGCFRLAEMGAMSNPDLTIVAKAVPRGVVCLISALAFHEITTQIPHAVDLALPAHAHRPLIGYPPVQTHWFGGKAYSEGVEQHVIDGVPIRIYGAAKTVADCFKCRNRVGLDVAVEALKLCRHRKRTTGQEFQRFAIICRVENVMAPYLEAVL